MDFKNENDTKANLECNETGNKSNDSAQENNEKILNKKEDEAAKPLIQEDISDEEDDMANLIADLYMTGPSTLPKEEQASGELHPQPLALPNNSSSDMGQVIGNLEASPGDDEDALIDRLLEELNHCVVGFIEEDENPRL